MDTRTREKELREEVNQREKELREFEKLFKGRKHGMHQELGALRQTGRIIPYTLYLCTYILYLIVSRVAPQAITRPAPRPRLQAALYDGNDPFFDRRIGHDQRASRTTITAAFRDEWEAFNELLSNSQRQLAIDLYRRYLKQKYGSARALKAQKLASVRLRGGERRGIYVNTLYFNLISYTLYLIAGASTAPKPALRKRNGSRVRAQQQRSASHV